MHYTGAFFNDWLIILASLLLGAFFIFLIASVGRRSFRIFNLVFSAPVERIVFSISFGLAAAFLVLFVVGIVGGLSLPVILILLAMTLVGTYKELLQTFKDFIQVFVSLPVWARLFLVAFLLFIILAALTPPHHSEELSYYLTVPRLYAQQGGIRALPDLWQSYIHSSLPLLTAVSFLFTGYPLARVLIVLINAVVPVAVYVFARRFFGAKSAPVAALLVGGMPLYALYQDLLVVDIASALFLIAGLYLIFLYLQEGADKKYLLAAGVLLGTAVSLKLSAGFFVLTSFVVSSLLILFRQQAERLFTRIILLSNTALLIVFFSSPWLLFEWWQTGNPFFPFFGKAVAGWGVIGAIQTQPLEFYQLVALPWLVSMHSYLGVGFIIFLPFIFFLKKKPQTTIPLLLISAATYVLYLAFAKDWFTISIFSFNDFVRYNFGVWTLLSVVVAYVIVHFWDNEQPAVKAAIAFFFLVYAVFWGGVQLLVRLPKINWLITQPQPLQSHEGFIKTVLPLQPSLIRQYNHIHPVVSYINSNLGVGSKVLTADSRVFYLGVPFQTTHGFTELPTWISYRTAEEFVARLKALHITHVIVPRYREWYTENMINFFNDNPELIRRGVFVEEFRWPDGVLYRSVYEKK